MDTDVSTQRDILTGAIPEYIERIIYATTPTLGQTLFDQTGEVLRMEFLVQKLKFGEFFKFGEI